MIDGKFDVVFRGQIVRNMDESVVKSNLVGLFKSSPEAVDKLFSGNEVVVRKELDYATAMKYQSALKKAGALALIKEIEQPTTASQPSQGKATFGVSAEDSSPTAETNDNKQSSTHTNVEPSRPKAQEAFEVSNRPQVEQSTPAAQQPELSSQNAQSQVAQNQDSAPQDSMTVAEPGAQILPDKVYEKREVDTSQLSLASAGERILPKKPPEEHPQPSIDHLKLED